MVDALATPKLADTSSPTFRRFCAAANVQAIQVIRGEIAAYKAQASEITGAAV